MKSIFALILFVTSGVFTSAQYYYKDILGAGDLNQMFSLYKNNNVNTVTLTGYDDQGEKSKDYSETHYFFPSHNVIRITTRNNGEVTNQFYRFDEKGSITSISDTSSSLISITTYNYDDKGMLASIKNVISDKEDSIYQVELHQWFYNEGGKPVRMLKIVNNNDTTDVRFSLDEKGNVIDEWPFINKLSRQKTYYYYDDRNRLTDIVRYNIPARKLLPDFMFQYSDQNQLIQKMTATATVGANYLVWRYSFDDRGLKVRETAIRKSKETGNTIMVGKIEYAYTFNTKSVSQ
jgi:hypothetical protein